MQQRPYVQCQCCYETGAESFSFKPHKNVQDSASVIYNERVRYVSAWIESRASFLRLFVVISKLEYDEIGTSLCPALKAGTLLHNNSQSPSSPIEIWLGYNLNLNFRLVQD